MPSNHQCFLIQHGFEIEVQPKVAMSHHLGMNYYVNFLGHLGNNGFQLKGRLEPLAIEKKNSGGYFGATSQQLGFPMDLKNTPISRFSCINVENPKKQADQFWASLSRIHIYYTKYDYFYILPKNWSAWFSEISAFRQLTLDMGVFIRSMGSPDSKDIKISMGKVHFGTTWFTPSLLGFLGHGWPWNGKNL